MATRKTTVAAQAEPAPIEPTSTEPVTLPELSPAETFKGLIAYAVDTDSNQSKKLPLDFLADGVQACIEATAGAIEQTTLAQQATTQAIAETETSRKQTELSETATAASIAATADARTTTTAAETATLRANAAAANPPKIVNNYWYTYNVDTETYTNTGMYVRGEAFTIKHIYASVDEMLADFDGTTVAEGEVVLINTGNVEEEDNAKIYVKGADAWVYLVDMSGAIGFTGKTPQFSIGTVTSGSEPALSITEDGLDDNGNPKFKFNAVLPKGDTGSQGLTGDQGVQGEKGDRPIRGVDYWTADDTTAILNDTKTYVDQSLSEVNSLILEITSKIA